MIEPGAQVSLAYWPKGMPMHLETVQGTLISHTGPTVDVKLSGGVVVQVPRSIVHTLKEIEAEADD